MDHPELSRSELHRYARHIALPEVGLEGQLRLKAGRVLCVGAGGLGSPLALYLAAAGVGTIGIVDFDDVDASNLQRQILHGTGDVGRHKLDSAADRLEDVNPHVEVVGHPQRLTSENALEILKGYDVVVDGTDNFPTRYLVNDACVLLGTPNVYGSVFRWEGQVSVFATKGGPCYRCLFREPPPPGLVPNCAEGGVLGVLPGIIGSMQAMETIKLLLGKGVGLAGRLLIFDALEMTWREIALRRNPECPVCSDSPTQTGLIDYELFCGVTRPGEGSLHSAEDFEELDAASVAALLASDTPPYLIDVREPWEWAVSSLAERGARLIPLAELGDRLGEVPKETPVVVYCRSGQRGQSAARQLVAGGYGPVSNLSGGLLSWAESVEPGLPVV
ncbi:MAG TPA: molybdopterin-synthase adenylyltransferase MoeB [Gemmatimonadetes bacterium]|jgi:adenylyltransferase/sulfurtransferase|nr:molybdenum cofactor biosynthesis protein MoeB [Gemmatimonadota bacterium]HIC53526.1 molybdopterin-synthase adenylyltransferase MoeB [Gemmatimonadota bacterium]HIN50818.1 molybdopterin-synthase adenylyltransferase MoeB [Gemmatimonadota bacterium]